MHVWYKCNVYVSLIMHMPATPRELEHLVFFDPLQSLMTHKQCWRCQKFWDVARPGRREEVVQAHHLVALRKQSPTNVRASCGHATKETYELCNGTSRNCPELFADKPLTLEESLFRLVSIRNNMKQGCWIMLTLPTAGFGPSLGSLHHQRPELAWI